MGKFVVGLIIGVIVGVLWVGYQPDLGERVRGTIDEATGTVLRGTEEAAETVGDAAGDAANEAGDAAPQPEPEQQPEGGTAQ